MTRRFQCLYTFNIYTIAFYIYVHYNVHKEVIHMEIIDITNSRENIFNFLTQIIKYKELLLEGKNTSLSECILEEEVIW